LSLQTFSEATTKAKVFTSTNHINLTKLGHEQEIFNGSNT